MRQIDVDLLRECLSYDYETGHMYWKKMASKHARRDVVGKRAGTFDRNSGYWKLHFDGGQHSMHRVVWAYVYGHMPNGIIDHINLDRSDNRIENLRVVDAGANSQNRGPHPFNKTGFQGVRKHHNRFHAVISIGKQVQKRIGCFDTAEEAYECYRSAKASLHPYAPELPEATA